MKTFDQFYTDIISDERWFYLLRHYKDETIKKGAEKVYAQLVADRTVDIRPMTETRKHVYNTVCKNPGDRVVKDWSQIEFEKIQKKEAEEKAKEWKPLVGEARQKALAEFKAMVDKSAMVNAVPRLTYSEIAKEGGWDRKKETPYPITSPMEVYIKERHIEYIKQNYDPRTAQPLPNWISESEFNISYDSRNMERYSGL